MLLRLVLLVSAHLSVDWTSGVVYQWRFRALSCLHLAPFFGEVAYNMLRLVLLVSAHLSVDWTSDVFFVNCAYGA